MLSESLCSIETVIYTFCGEGCLSYLNINFLFTKESHRLKQTNKQTKKKDKQKHKKTKTTITTTTTTTTNKQNKIKKEKQNKTKKSKDKQTNKKQILTES